MTREPMPPCYDGGRHRWRTKYRPTEGAPYAGRYWWCEKCGREVTKNPR